MRKRMLDPEAVFTAWKATTGNAVRAARLLGVSSRTVLRYMEDTDYPRVELVADEIERALDECGGNRREVARQLGISRQTVLNYINKIPRLHRWKRERRSVEGLFGEPMYLKYGQNVVDVYVREALAGEVAKRAE